MFQIKQTMSLDEKGFLLTSCDTIFSTEEYLGENMILKFPFLESVFSELRKKLVLGVIIRFPKVETKHTFLSGYYDYIFKIIRIQNGKLGIQWEIIDATEQYKVLKEQQQEDHENSLYSG